MQDFDAALADPGSAFAGLRVRRLTGARRSAPTVTLRENLPELLDTRRVRAELLRLRGPAPARGRRAPSPADGWRGG
jgi:hypothetical protein